MSKKLSLKDMSVKSFVTDLKQNESASLKGGSGDCLKTLGDCLTGMYPSINMPCTHESVRDCIDIQINKP
ncbi:MAG: pinensin family lanthipeptide [Luteibaculum sp.]